MPRPEGARNVLAGLPLGRRPHAGSERESPFDRIARLAAACLGAPTAMICLVDAEQRFHSCVGFADRLPRNGRNPQLARFLCEQVVGEGGTLVVADTSVYAAAVPRAAAGEIAVAAFAGVPLTAPDGAVVGTLCVVDYKTRLWSDHSLALLRDIAATAVSEIRLRSRSGDPGPTVTAPDDHHLESLLEALPEMVSLIDTDGSIRYTSPAVESLLGYTVADLDGRSYFGLVHEDDRDMASRVFRQLAERPGGSARLELRFRHRTDGWRVVDWTATNVDGVAPGPAVVASARDVTPWKETELRNARQLERLTALRAIDLAVAGSPDIRTALGAVLDQVRALLNTDAAAILLLQPHARLLEYVEGRGFRVGRFRESVVQLGEGSAGRVAAERRAVHIEDIREPGSFERAELVAGEGFVAYLGVPLMANGRVRGVLELFHRSPLRPDPDWTECLESLATQAALSIENRRRLESMQRSRAELSLAYDATLEGIAHALELRCKDVKGHTRRVTDTTIRLARLLGLDDAELVHVRRGALLHDFGNLGVPEAILHKAGPLTEEERGIVRLHPGYARYWLYPIRALRSALDIPYCHHERWNGSGYPRGLKGTDIPLSARIFAIADTWDALRSDRPYRRAWSADKAREHLRDRAGHDFDPEVVKMFLQLGAT